MVCVLEVHGSNLGLRLGCMPFVYFLYKQLKDHAAT
jgi:hypothetical protein